MTYTNAPKPISSALRCIVFMAVFAGGCATLHSPPRPFFLVEQDRESHGRKTWFDHLVEVDPGGVKVEVAEDYAQNPPRRIAVLPFINHGSAQFIVNKVPLTFRDGDTQAAWSWTRANRLRRALTGYLAQREFTVVNLHTVDTVLADHGITDANALQAVSPEQLGQWLHADTVVYGDVNHYEAYYAFLLANWHIGVEVRMVATADGHKIFTAAGSRYSVDLRPAFSLMDMGVNSVLNLLQFRDVNVARAEDEVGREILLRLPIAERNVATLVADAHTLSDTEGRKSVVVFDTVPDPTWTQVSVGP